MTHQTKWEDGGSAQLGMCGSTKINDGPTLTAASYNLGEEHPVAGTASDP